MPAMSTALRTTLKILSIKDMMLKFMRQAHMYLQARINQPKNYSIIQDQARYMTLIYNRFLPQYSTPNITTEEKQDYQALLPASSIPSKQD